MGLNHIASCQRYQYSTKVQVQSWVRHRNLLHKLHHWYFSNILRLEFNYIPFDADVDKILERQVKILEEESEEPEQFNKLQIVKSLKEHKEKIESKIDNKNMRLSNKNSVLLKLSRFLNINRAASSNAAKD